MIEKHLVRESYILRIEATCVEIGSEKSFSISQRIGEGQTFFVEGTAEEIQAMSNALADAFRNALEAAHAND